MNRRHFFAATLPALLGSAALPALAQGKLSRTAPRRVRIEASLLKPTLTLGETNAQIIVVIAQEGVETYAAFLQMYTYKANTADHTVTSQAYGPKLTVTPHLQANGQITLTGKIEFEEATSAAAPNEPLAISTHSQSFVRTLTSGEAVLLGGLIIDGVRPQQIQLTATLLPAP